MEIIYLLIPLSLVLVAVIVWAFLYQPPSRGALPERPMVELTLPSALDESLAPPGQHVASLFCQHVAPELPANFPGGSSWDDHRETVADLAGVS